jgi:hypothetical protein
MKVVYVAHPLGASEDRELNRANAAKWCAYLAKTYKLAPVADWIVLSGVWNETTDLRELGLSIDKALIERCDELVMVGGRISPGMAIEAEHARACRIPVTSLLHLGYEVPE